jgi:hypothetical protein
VVAVWRDTSAVGFRITFADRPRLEPGERVSIVLDSDQNRRTGNPHLSGADMLLSYGTLGGRTFGGQLVHWKGSGWRLGAGDRGKVRFQPGKGVLQVVLDRGLLRGRGFNWLELTFQAGQGRGADSAPEENMSSYSLAAGTLAGDSGTKRGSPCGRT